ncbi:putative transcriptional regulatory protein C8D2.12c [Colletotrichum chlorophyti]|uniref:Putative transcriptional regulatory protein C8D2.12c n=1 Tax=Colletotrichum chlorophyti TaxID=708187 RepID=A0A1Q8RBV9_9PEZI|nr:putative transcriptional regulatory protein C8D2.12c [Colletotrichum chlorophyti]
MLPFTAASLRTLASRVAAPVPKPRSQPTFCRACLRPFSTTPAVQSGHNKWSKIKHRKGAADAQKNNTRSQHSKTITLYSRHAVPKSVIDSAIARGQGRSASGASLESLTLEAIMPPGVALIIDVETESKGRSLQDLKVLIKKHKGTVNAATFFFTRLGRVVFEAKEGGPSIDDIMDDAIEAGAEDLDADDEGNLVIWTQPNMTNAVANSVGPKFELKLLSSEIIWSANEDTKVKIDAGVEATTLGELLTALQEFPEVQAVYSNPVKGNIPEEEWSKIEENLDS